MKSVLKKVAPVTLVLILILIITGIASCISKSKEKTLAVTGGNENYISLSETLGGKTFTYSVSKEDLYEKLKSQIGLSSLVTMFNKELLKQEINENTNKSYWDSVEESEITKAIDEACYGEKVDVSKLTSEEKTEKEEEFINSMYTGYGYSANTIYDA